MPSTTTYKRGQVIVVSVTFSDQTGSKPRPVMVASTEDFHRDLPDLIVCPISNRSGTRGVVAGSLDEAGFAETIQQHRYASRVDADLQAGFQRGIRGSPVVFVNTKRIDGVLGSQTNQTKKP